MSVGLVSINKKLYEIDWKYAKKGEIVEIDPVCASNIIQEYGVKWAKEDELGQKLVEVIATDASTAITYAIMCGGRWPQDRIGKMAEATISKHSSFVIEYCRRVLKSAWPEDSPFKEIAEINIASDSNHAREYAVECSGEKWSYDTEIGRMAEENIRKVENNSYSYIFKFRDEISMDQRGWEDSDMWKHMKYKIFVY